MKNLLIICMALMMNCIHLECKSQNQWLKLSTYPSYSSTGDLDVTGNQITVEAIFYETPQGIRHDLVSKHGYSSDANYLLRGDHCEIATSNGFFNTSNISFSLNQCYHVAFTYNGQKLRFYQNGCLKSEVNATGNLVTNSYPLRIGQIADPAQVAAIEQFYGYIDEVRIWNVCRTQQQIVSNMTNLINPTTQIGLLAYYKFDNNYLNSQGNTTWNLNNNVSTTFSLTPTQTIPPQLNVNLGNDTSICQGNIILNANNSGCSYQWSTGQTTQSITVSSGGIYSVIVTNIYGCIALDTIVVSSVPSTVNFIIPDTVCVNQNFTIQNTTLCGSSYYWNFCSGSISNTPLGLNLGNLGTLSQPVFSSIAKDGNNYYVFISNDWTGTLTRLSFGNSLINTPVATNLGSFGGALAQYIQGIQIKKDSISGNWYGFILGGQSNYLTRLSFGNSLSNTPTAVNLGNISNLLSYSLPIYTFFEGGNWYSLVANSNINTIVRLNHGNSLANIPTATNLGNIGSLNGAIGFSPVFVNGVWYLFVVNRTNNTISRLNFGNSLLNNPSGVNLGNISNTFHYPRSITIYQDCGQVIGFVTNETTNDIVRLTFPNGITSTPSGFSIGNIGNLSFPHHISEIFRVGDSLYSFIMNVSNNTLSRLCFPSCSNSSIPSSILQNPLPMSYNTTGTYNISLSVNEGLPSQSSLCKDIVVISTSNVNLGNDTSVCQGNTLTLNAGNPGYSYLWNTLQTSQTINVTSSGTYSVIVSNGSGCIGYDTINVLINPTPLDINDSIFVSHHGILAHYPFDNHTFDISGHNYHGVLNGPIATTDRLINSNKAYSFNGNNQFVNVPHDIWSDELSLSAWVYSTDLGTTDPTQTGKMIFFKAPNTGVNQDYTLAVAYINSGFRAQFVFGQGASQFFYVNSNTIIQTNQWYLITATRKNGIAKLYINGNLDNTATYPFIPVNQHFNLKLGMSHASSQSFAGKLDDLRIYKRALCAREVKSLYHNQYLLKVKLQDTILCNNGSTFLDIINPEPGISYQLQSYPSGNPIGIPQITYCDSILSFPTGNITSTSYFTILATDTVTGCSNQLDSIFKVSISPDVIVNLGNDTTICQTNTFVLNAGNVGCTYLWNTGSSASTQNLGISVSGVYSVIVTNIYGCKGYDTINVVFISFLPVNLGNDTTICIGESVVLDAGISGAIYLWNTNATSQSINVTNAGSYWVAVNSNGCIGSDTIIVNTVPKPTISLGNDTIMCPGDLIVLTPGSGFTQYLWSDGATSNSINVNIPGNYSVTVSNGACFVSDEIIIEECGSEIWIPNVFTPNGDGINETFYPVCFNIDKISMLIFNRWGNQLFEGSGKVCVWDGKYNGELCPDGVYYYLIEYEQKGKLKGMQKRHGSVTLLR